MVLVGDRVHGWFDLRVDNDVVSGMEAGSVRVGDHDLHCINHGVCDGMDELLRGIRNDIGKIEIRSNDGWRVRAEALTLLINAQHRSRHGA